MLHITSHYHNFIIIYTACLAHVNAHYIHLNTCSTRKSVTSLRSMEVLSSRVQERRNFCRAGRRSGEAARKIKLFPPQSPRFSALARLYYLACPTKTAMLRRLKRHKHGTFITLEACTKVSSVE